jgi:hypothetical protein
MIDLPHSPNYLLPDTNYSYRAKKDSEILDAGEREHEEMNDITAIWLLKRHKVTHV